jgi:hypothetical protein
MYQTEGRLFYEDGTTEVKESPIYVASCAKEECDGMVASNWICLKCDTKICEKCLEATTKDDVHTCDPAIVASVKSIRKECKPCPSCGIRVFRIEGCSQMFCTVCHTGFCWNTGEVVRVESYFHNPHYTEWLRKVGINGRGSGDQLCRVENCEEHVRKLSSRALALDIFLVKYCHYSSKIREIDNECYNRRLNNMIDHLGISLNEMMWSATNENEINRIRHEEELEKKDLFVSFLLGNVNADDFRMLRQRQNKASMKKQDIRQLVSTFVTMCIEILTNKGQKELHPNYYTNMSSINKLHEHEMFIEEFSLIIGSLNTAKEYYHETMMELCACYGHTYTRKAFFTDLDIVESMFRDYKDALHELRLCVDNGASLY